MNTLQRSKDVLFTAEQTLAALASEAAKSSEYDSANLLIELARELNVLAKRVERGLQGGSLFASSNPIIDGFSAKTRKAKKKSYPMFFRQGDDLVKIGWSPSEKSEYEHKSPKKVLLLLAAAISKAGTNGKRFAMDRILPLQDTEGTPIPDYQVYLSLAWFRELGFVVQHGRQGYSLASKAPIEPLLETHWASLPGR